jgi:hypothetical protein
MGWLGVVRIRLGGLSNFRREKTIFLANWLANIFLKSAGTLI